MEWTRVMLEGCSREKLRSRAMNLRDALGCSDKEFPLPSSTTSLIEWILTHQAADTEFGATPSCHLYLDGPFERILNELRAAGKLEGPLEVEDTLGFDQMHYCGTDAIDVAVKNLGIKATDSVADIGSGFGGPARYLAKSTGCSVTGYELQEQLVRGSALLTERMGMSSQVKFVHADFTTVNAKDTQYDHLFSILTVLHVPDRAAMFSSMFTVLRPGGKVYLEDMYCRSRCTAEEARLLRDVVGCPLLPTQAEYEEQLRQAGFCDIDFVDVADEWIPFTAGRAEAWDASEARNLHVHGARVTATMAEFYQSVARLFAGRNLSGVRLTCTKPLQ